MISEISCLLYFPDGNWPPCWIFKSIKFYMQTWSGGSTHSTMPNFLETGLSNADILRFFKFSKCLLPPLSWIFEMQNVSLFGWRGSRLISMPNFVKIGRSVAKILRFFSIFKDGGRRHHELLKLQNFICWWCSEGPYASLYQISWKSVFPCGDIAIFQIFKMAAAAILDFWNCEVLLAIGVERVETHQRAKFC